MTGSRKRKAEVRKERKKKKNEEEEKEGEREEGEKRDGRAKNRWRPGRKEGAENEGELRSALESPAASRSALSRWISWGRYRSLTLFAPRLLLSLSLYPLRSSRPRASTFFHFALRPSLSLGHEAGEDEARRYLLSFPRPQRNDRAPPPRHHFMMGCSTARLPPGASSAQR